MLKERITLTDEIGQTMAEYAFVLGVITLIIVTSLTFFSEAVAAAISAVDAMIRSVS